MIHSIDYFASTKPFWAVVIVRIIQVNSPKNIVGVKNYRLRVVLKIENSIHCFFLPVELDG